jgi:hypothetical protein
MPLQTVPSRLPVPAGAGPLGFGHEAPGHALLDGLKTDPRDRALVLGHGAIDLVCALIRHGLTEVTEWRCGDRPEAGVADLVLIPKLRSADQAVMLVSHARRALAPTGRVAAQVPGDLAAGLVRTLRLHGFSAIRRRDAASGSIVSGTVPASLLRA